MTISRRIPACIVATAMTIATPAVAAPPTEPETPTEVPETPASAEPLEPTPIAPPPPFRRADEIPSWETAPAEPESTSQEPFDPPPELRPPDGKGHMAVGWILLGGGLVLTASSTVLLFEDDPAQVFIWIGGASLGSVAVAAGLTTLLVGAVRGRRYEPWQTKYDAPASGNGMLAGGVTAMLGGTVGIILGGISLARQGDEDLPYGQVLVPLGVASLATGATLMVVGGKRRSRFAEWERATFGAVPTISLLRTPQMQPAGATLGIAGRF